jgi:hypothetical protein
MLPFSVIPLVAGAREHELPWLPESVYFAYSFVVLVVLCIFYFFALFSMSIFPASLMTIMFLPIALLALGSPVLFLIVFTENDICHNHAKQIVVYLILTTSLVTAPSFAVTHLALLLGHVLYPFSIMIRTPQLLLVNVLFDTLSVLITVLFMEWALSKNPIARLPVAIFSTIMLLAVLAWCSLYVGTLGSIGLSSTQVSRIFVGLSRSAAEFEFGPLFWAMHSVYLPILIFLSITLLGWFVKLIIGIAIWMLGAARVNRNPLKLFALMLGIAMALIQLLKALFENWGT